MRLFPLTAYYIRKLLHQRETKLQFIVAPGAGVQADLLTDLNQVLESLYIEESEICKIAGELEKLARLHQMLMSQETKHIQELSEIERQIFWILGFKTR
jgi:hypothetical protein